MLKDDRTIIPSSWHCWGCVVCCLLSEVEIEVDAEASECQEKNSRRDKMPGGSQPQPRVNPNPRMHGADTMPDQGANNPAREEQKVIEERKKKEKKGK
jgi:hypothetical protein